MKGKNRIKLKFSQFASLNNKVNRLYPASLVNSRPAREIRPRASAILTNIRPLL